MSKLGSIDLQGVSGKRYTFGIYSTSTSWNAVGAVYAFTKATAKQSGGYTHKMIYFGETGSLQDRITPNHHKMVCINRNGANRICVLVESSAATRRAIEKDLIASYSPPCND